MHRMTETRSLRVFDYNSIKFMGLLQEMNEDQFYQDRIVYGGALNYQGVGVDAIARRMKLKMEQGCSFFLTQPIYADADVERIKDLKDRTGAKDHRRYYATCEPKKCLVYRK